MKSALCAFILTLCTAFWLSAAHAAQPPKYLIKFKEQISVRDGIEILKEHGFDFDRYLPEIRVFIATPSVAAREESAVESIQVARQIKYIEKNKLRWRTDGIATPSDPMWSSQPEWRQIGVERAWRHTVGSYDVVVAVSDTGYLFNHPDLKNQVWTNTGEIAGNGVDDDENGFIDDVHGWDFVNKDNDPHDDNGHGTHVAGIIGAEANNGVGIAGVSWRVRLMPVKFLSYSGYGDDIGAVDSILYSVNNGARIINASWGASERSPAITDAIAYAWANGVIMIAAAGNDGSSNDFKPHYPSNDAVPGIIAVAASTITSGLAYFSNFGRTTVDVAAPGVNIFSTYKDGHWKRLSGTSMATPMVAGVGALILAKAPGLSALDLKNAILNAVTPQSSFRDRCSTGGEINAELAVSQLDQGFQVWPSRVRLNQGESFQFSAFGAASAVTWSTDNGSVASINDKGELTASQTGKVTVTAKDSAGRTVSTRSVEIINTARRGD